MSSNEPPEGHSYTGRFAPSPTGPLHFGSAVAALASFLQARRCGGRWLVRIEDLDPPREQQGASAHILDTLENLGLLWDGEIVYQSQRSELYDEVLESLKQRGSIYPCACTRKQVGKGPYPGFCKQGIPAGKKGRSLRVHAPSKPIRFHDQLQGDQDVRVDLDFGDFIIRRADGLTAYHLATVIDDDRQGVSEVVRGADLLETTVLQIHLQRVLGLREQAYLHVPMAIKENGNKLSKQTKASPIHTKRAEEVILHALRFLGQRPSSELSYAKVPELIAWAISNWDVDRIPHQRAITAPQLLQ